VRLTAEDGYQAQRSYSIGSLSLQEFVRKKTVTITMSAIEA
jgi:hypothetical protein